MRRCGLAVSLLFGLLSSSACYCDWTENEILKASQKIGETGLASKKAPTSSPLQFKPTDKRLIVSEYVKDLGDTAIEREAYEQAIVGVIESFEGIAKELKQENDGALALAFAVSVLHSSVTGVEMNDDSFIALAERFRATFDTESIKKLPDAKKQEFYEISLCSSGIVLLISAAGAESEGIAESVKAAAEAQLTVLLGAKSSQMKLSGKDVSVKGSEPVKTELSNSSMGTLPSDFSYQMPAQWENSNGWMSKSVSESGSVKSAHIKFLPAIKPSGSFSDALRKAFREGVPTQLHDIMSGMVYRRYLGDGVVADFVFAYGMDGVNQTNTLYTAYLLDLGSTWLPMIVAQTYADPGLGSAANMSASFALNDTVKFAEELIKLIRCPSATKRVFIDRDALIGDYSYGTGSSLQWENVYTGATTMTTVSYSGTLNLKADGSFTYTFSSASGQVGALKFAGAKGAGKWRVERDLLICDYTSYDQGDSYKRVKETYRIGGVVTFANGQKVVVLKTNLDQPINQLTVSDRSDYFSTKGKE